MKNKNRCSKCQFFNFEKIDAENSMGRRAICLWGRNSEMAKSNKTACLCEHFKLHWRFEKSDPLLEYQDFKLIYAMTPKTKTGF